jgi:hypothetical protein
VGTGSPPSLPGGILLSRGIPGLQGGGVSCYNGFGWVHGCLPGSSSTTLWSPGHKRALTSRLQGGGTVTEQAQLDVGRLTSAQLISYKSS